MKKNLFTQYSPWVAAIFLCFQTSCKDDFLVEKPVTTLTTDTYYKTEAGFEDLVRSCYPLLRNIHQNRVLVLNGTDIFAAQNGWNPDATGKVLQPSAYDVYDARFNATIPELQTLWQQLYAEIARTNTVVSRAEDITTMTQALKDTRVSEAKFLRALCLFYAVQHWGDIPMPLSEVTTPGKDFPRVPSAEVYKQIISDLTECEAKLPVTATNYGRATKGAAQFLLARVYLTRGWNFKNALGGSPADFDMALQYADKIIDTYPLAANYGDLFPKRTKNPLKQYTGAQNDKNPEIVFSVQYGSDVLTNKTDPAYTQDAAGGNDLHSKFGASGEGLPGNKGRTSDYNRCLGIHTPTAAAYRLFDPTKDLRYDHNFVEVGYALQAVSNFRPLPLTNPGLTISIAAGDTVLYCRPWNQPATTLAERGVDLGGTKKYAVVNTYEFGGGYPIVNTGFQASQPLMWKFWQPNIPYGDAFGTFNESLFRAAEAYLIAAEAIMKGAKGGKLGGAEVYYNKVLDRALGANQGTEPLRAAAPEDQKSLETASYRATAGTLSIDMILDERARELMGEYCRWFDLKRTGKLVERIKKYNPWSAGQQIKDIHTLRPIPQGEIDLSFPSMTQNEGY
ncbi:RagB/SusD family nutrient uptake outer membrane protein [Arundinibacter roseus]|uniref:RagB/SusD family nutrient uptake outer membrane protein n=1 Tax=Arundinibacter roseus TaxID=2070510 RepID=A0A4R4K9I6_9BACT|nr:RagB/SusD family nutrient uptake outer membrane protein [Arundinibacter roseus]TDB64183.1 RagB/SusD family nutrient uptake outer membrane protein [Arundinibacter roseus]